MLKSPYATANSTAPKRLALATRLATLATVHGWVVETESDSRELYVTLTKGPRRVSVSFDGARDTGVFMAHWHSTLAATGPLYWHGFSNSVNTCHWQRATTLEPTADSFFAEMAECFAKVDAATPAA